MEALHYYNVVFDFLGGYYVKMEKELNNITGTDKETVTGEYTIIKCQKWLLSQNNVIVKKLYGYYI